MSVAQNDVVDPNVITTIIEDGFQDLVRSMRMQNEQNTLWEKFTHKTEANGAENVLQTWLEDIRAMQAWDSEKQFDDLVERRYKVTHTPWHTGVKMNLRQLKARIKEFGGMSVSVGVERFAMDIRDKLAHRAAEIDVKKVLDQLTSPTTLGYDLKALFAADHEGSQGNQDAGGGAQHHYLMALGHRGMPVIRVNGGVNDEEFAIKDHTDENTWARFLSRDLYWGVEFDGGWFPGEWRTIYRSNQSLDATELDSNIQDMSAFVDARGEQQGLVPTHLLVGRSKYRAARALLNTMLVNSGDSNVDRGIVDIIYSARLP